MARDSDGALAARFAHLSVEQGLSQSTVQVVHQDSAGFLWFGTEEGLNRYDGYAVSVFKHDPARPQSLPDDRVRALLSDREGRLWVGTDRGLSLFDRRSETFTAVPSIQGRVTGMVEEPDGTLWIGSEGYGVFERNPATGAFLLHQNQANDPSSFASYLPSALLRDRKGRIWIGTRNAGLERLQRDGPGAGAGASSRRFVHYRHDPRDPGSLGHDEVWGLAEDAAGTLWVATYGGGLSALDPETGAFRHHRHRADDPGGLATDLVTCVFSEPSGALWIGTDGGGVQRYDSASGTFASLRHDPLDSGSLSQDVIRTFFQDRQGQLWVGTYLGGADVLRRPRHPFGYFTHDPSDPRSLGNATISSFLEDSKGRLWVGTAAGWLHRFEPQSATFVRYRLPSSMPGALALHEDRRGRMWVGSYRGGLARLDPDRGSSTVYVNRPGDAGSIANDEVWAIAEDDRGMLWLGTNAGVDRFDPDGGRVTAHYDTPRGEDTRESSGVRALHFDRRGTLWVGDVAGLRSLPPGGDRLVRVRPDDLGLRQDGVVALHEDGGGILWLGTLGGGLRRLDPATGSLTSYKDFASNVIYGIQPDASGRLWVSTNYGLARFDPATHAVWSFDLTNGLQSLQFHMGSSLRRRSGRLLFGSVAGYYDFDPQAITPDRQVPPIVFTSLRVFNEPMALPAAVSASEEVTLAHRDKVFSLEFAALDYAIPRRNRYAYRMEGFSDRWIELGARRDVTFTNLDPGRYVFRVKASNGDGVWNEAAAASIRVIVRPPVWGTWWFRALAAASVAFVLFAVHRLRVRRLTADLAERTRAEAALRSAEEKYRNMVAVLQSTLESTADGILVVDAARRVVSSNDRLAQLWSLPEHELRGDAERFLAHVRQQLRSPDAFEETTRRMEREVEAESFDVLEFKDGRVFECYSLPHRLDGAAVGRVWSFREITERRRAEEKIEYQAYHDSLTGLPNRLLLTDRLTQSLVHAQRHQRRLAVLFLDVDHFKLLNDTLGHAGGDRVLRGVAERLSACVRADDTVARVGGDEFTLLFSDLEHGDHAPRMAEKVLHAFEEPFVVEGETVDVTVSMGLALYPEDGDESDVLLRNADSAMYKAKELGRNNFQLCTPGMNARALERMSLESGLRRALERGEFVLHYQPLVDLASGRWVGTEALLRWQHPQRGLIPPETFIPLAEESRLILPLGDWVIHAACLQLARWRAAGLGSLRMCINLSMRQLQQKELSRSVEDALARSGVPAQSLELEITESVAMHNVEWTKSVLRALRDMGVSISVDDFGTGQSSLSHLKHFPLSTLKIDRSFVRDIAVDPDDEAIVRAVIALAHTLKLSVIAEGVETEDQLAFLKEAGCEEGQGYLFCEPLAASALESVLDAGRAPAWTS